MASDGLSFARRVLITVGIVVAVGFTLWLTFSAFSVLMLLFAGVLVGVLLNALAHLLQRVAPIPYKAAVGVVTLVLLGLVVGFFIYLGPALADQAEGFQEAVIAAVDEAGSFLGQYDWGERVLDEIPSVDEMLERAAAGGLVGQVTGAVSTLLSAGFDVFILLFVGIYLALNPSVYVNNAIRLFPQHRRERLHEVVARTSHALKLWLVGQFISMAFVAVFVTVGLWILGVPLALLIGVISFVLGFIPYIGPILAAVPALLVALLVGPETVLYVAILYFILEQIQSYVVIPLVQEAVVSLPPVLLIAAQLLFAAFGGLLGIALAAPIAVVAVVMIQMLYVEDALGDRVPVIGSDEDDKSAPEGAALSPE